jgi:hypothetical protein
MRTCLSGVLSKHEQERQYQDWYARVEELERMMLATLATLDSADDVWSFTDEGKVVLIKEQMAELRNK